MTCLLYVVVRHLGYRQYGSRAAERLEGGTAQDASV